MSRPPEIDFERPGTLLACSTIPPVEPRPKVTDDGPCSTSTSWGVERIAIVAAKSRMPSMNRSLRAVNPRMVRLSPWAPPSPAARLMPATLRNASRNVVTPCSLHDGFRHRRNRLGCFELRLRILRRRRCQRIDGGIDVHRRRHRPQVERHRLRRREPIVQAGAGQNTFQRHPRCERTGYAPAMATCESSHCRARRQCR